MMTVYEIKQKIAELEAQLENIESAEADIKIFMDEAEKKKLHEEDLQRIRGFRLIDDDFMNVCFDGYIEGTELLLRIILNKPDIHVKKVTTQKLMKNLQGRDIWLDIDADDDEGVEYNIEIQRADRGAGFKRARYHSSILDAHLLRPKEDFSKLPETYVILITENDVIGKGKPIYVVERRIVNIDEPFDDGEHIIYVNGADKNASTALGRLMHDFFCTNADDMNYRELAEKVRYFKEDEKGIDTMCKVMEDMRNETAKRAAEQEKFNIAQSLIKMGKLSMEEIAASVQLSLEKVQELALQIA